MARIHRAIPLACVDYISTTSSVDIVVQQVATSSTSTMEESMTTRNTLTSTRTYMKSFYHILCMEQSRDCYQPVTHLPTPTSFPLAPLDSG
eukprot:100826-Amphidinium_carterae.1